MKTARQTLSVGLAAALCAMVAGCSNTADTPEAAGTTETTATTGTTMETSSTTEAMTSEATTPGATSADTAATGGSARPTVVAALASSGQFTTLSTALQASGLDQTLSGQGPFTLFAPNDQAFTQLSTGTLPGLLADPQGQLRSVLSYHVVPQKVMAAQVATMNGQTVSTVNGAQLTVVVQGDKVMLRDAKGGTVNVVQTDIEAGNGVIHGIDGVLMP